MAKIADFVYSEMPMHRRAERGASFFAPLLNMARCEVRFIGVEPDNYAPAFRTLLKLAGGHHQHAELASGMIAYCEKPHDVKTVYALLNVPFQPVKSHAMRDALYL